MSDQRQGIVLIGNKPIMNYVVACLTLFNLGKKTITVRARGLVISHAVDTVELLRRAFIKDLEIKEITIDSQEFKKINGLYGSIPMIDIVISKSKRYNN